MKLPSLVATLLVSLWISGIGARFSYSQEKGETCAAINSADERLKCFDDAFGRGLPADPAIQHCEAAVKARIKTPSTFILIGASVKGNIAYLEFDAQNSFGALIRSHDYCEFMAVEESVRIVGENDLFAVRNARLSPLIPRADTAIDFEEANRLAVVIADEARQKAEVDAEKARVKAEIAVRMQASTKPRLIENCRTALKLPSGSGTANVINLTSGEREVYIRFAEPPRRFTLAMCRFVAGDLKETRIITP